MKYKSFLVAILVAAPLLAFSAKAPPQEFEARGDGVTVRISSPQCTNKKVLDLVKEEYHRDFKRAEIRKFGKTIPACWIVDTTGIYVVGEDGDRGYVPIELFKPVEVI